MFCILFKIISYICSTMQKNKNIENNKNTTLTEVSVILHGKKYTSRSINFGRLFLSYKLLNNS